MIDLFKYILIREAGISKQLLLDMPTIDETYIKSKLIADTTFHEYRNELSSYIGQLIATDESPSIQVYLKNIQRAITNGTTIKEKDLNKILTHSFKATLIQRIESYKALKNICEKIMESCLPAFEMAQLNEVAYLFKQKEEPNLQNGLLFSSAQFHNQLTKTNFDGKNFNKKTKQTFLKLLEYISRASCKTSPFSSFGKIGFYHLKNRVGVEPIQSNILHTNAAVQLDDNTSSFIGLNPTIFEDTDHYYFFILENDGEALTGIPKDDAIIAIYNSLKNSKSNTDSFQEALSKIDVKIKEELITIGFFVKATGSSNNNITYSIDKIRSNLQKENNTNAKKEIIDELKEVLIKPYAIYEDCYINPTTAVPSPHFEEITKELNQLTKIIAPLYFNTMHAKFVKFCRENLDKDAAINLVELIQATNELPADYLKEEIKLKKQDRKYFQDLLENMLHKKNVKQQDGILHINLDIFNFVKKQPQPNYFATHFQIETKEDKPLAIINSISNGAGKLFGRFAIQYDKVVNDLKTYIYNNANGFQLVLNQDFSSSPVNTHPPIINQKIATPNIIDGSISPGNLFVNYDQKENELSLTYKDGTVIKMINLGVESESTRNYFYPYLSAFTGTRCVIQPFLEIINNLTADKENEIYQLPRLQIGNHLILQRKSWHIPTNLIPKKENAETDAAYFMKIQAWIKTYNIPNQVFLKTNSSWFSNQLERTSNDQHKPQYIDFSKIGFVLLFNKKSKQVTDFLELTETLPCFNSTTKKVQEYALEWFG